jgi:hypothetical protein
MRNVGFYAVGGFGILLTLSGLATATYLGFHGDLWTVLLPTPATVGGVILYQAAYTRMSGYHNGGHF